MHQRTYYNPKKRGRKPIFNEEQTKEIVRVADAMRAKGAPLDAPTLGAAARGLYEKKYGSLGLRIHGGNKVFSNEWSRKVLEKHGFGVYKATTDRCITAAEIVAAAEGLISNIDPNNS